MTSTTPIKEDLASTGINGLDEILGGGLPENHFYLLEGRPGTGKTTLALQFLLEGARLGEAGLYVTLSESKAELKAVARSHGWNLDQISLFELTAPDDSALPDAQYTYFHPSEVELGTTTKTLLHQVDQVKPRRVVFDSLSEMRLLARDPLRYRRQVMGLKQYFTGRDCTVLVLDDLTSADSDLQPQSIAHGVISLEVLSPEYGADKRRLRVLKMRGTQFYGGYHDVVIETGGLKVFPRLIASDHSAQFESGLVSSDIKELDALVAGGLERGSSTLVLGPAGSGKSTIASAWAVAAARRGENVAIYLFEEGERSYIHRSGGVGQEVKEFVESGQITIHQIDPAEMAPGQFAHLVRASVEQDKARVVIIDSLSGYLHAMPEERFLILHMHELLSYLNQMGVVTLLIVAQHGLLSTRSEGNAIDVSYIADSVILTRFFEAAGRVRKAISIVKRRSGNHEDTIRELMIGETGVQVGEPLNSFQGVLTGVPQFFGEAASLMGKPGV